MVTPRISAAEIAARISDSLDERQSTLTRLIGAKIRGARIDQRLSVDALCRNAHFSFRRLTAIENGLERPTPSELWDLAQCLRRPLSYFVIESEDA
jgi:transcriptional regulator with XRE-family HTH domain